MSVYGVYIHINPHMGLFYPIKLPPIYQKMIVKPPYACFTYPARCVWQWVCRLSTRPNGPYWLKVISWKLSLFVSILTAYGVTITFLHTVAFNNHKIQYWQYFNLFELSQSSLHIIYQGWGSRSAYFEPSGFNTMRIYESILSRWKTEGVRKWCHPILRSWARDTASAAS